MNVHVGCDVMKIARLCSSSIVARALCWVLPLLTKHSTVLSLYYSCVAFCSIIRVCALLISFFYLQCRPCVCWVRHVANQSLYCHSVQPVLWEGGDESADWRGRNIWASAPLWSTSTVMCCTTFPWWMVTQRCADSRIFFPTSHPSLYVCDHVTWRWYNIQLYLQ